MGARDTRWLELHGGKWRVTLSVPRSLHKRLGTRLKRSLGTDSLTAANRLKWRVVEQLRAEIELARGNGDGTPLIQMQDALNFRAQVKASQSAVEEDELRRFAAERAETLLGPPVAFDVDRETDEPYPIYGGDRERLARTFMSVATGDGMPLLLHYDEYVSSLTLKQRTIADDQRAIALLGDWCAKNGMDDDVRSITTKAAKQFAADLPNLTRNIAPPTVKKYVVRLSQYWNWMVYKEVYPDNPWKSVVVKVAATPHEEQERPFTDEEVRRLLTGPAPQKLKDLMMIGALTGARLDAIVDLKSRDAVDGCFTFKAQKKEPAPRDVPIHPALREIVERRTRDKGPGDDFFPEWPGPKKPGSLRERSFKASNQFTAYRRACGVDERVDGRRRSLVNFHSFRRWFITKAEQAGQNGDLIAAIVGHKRSGITLGRYSAGPEMKSARRCVASVRLPPEEGPIKEPQLVTPRRGRARAGAQV